MPKKSNFRRRNVQEALREATKRAEMAAGNQFSNGHWIVLEDYMEAHREQILHDFTQEHPGEKITEDIFAERTLDMLNREVEDSGKPIIYLCAPDKEGEKPTKANIIVPANMDTAEHNAVKDDMPTVNHYEINVPDMDTLTPEQQNKLAENSIDGIVMPDPLHFYYDPKEKSQNIARKMIYDSRGEITTINVIDTNGRVNKVKLDARDLFAENYKQLTKKESKHRIRKVVVNSLVLTGRGVKTVGKFAIDASKIAGRYGVVPAARKALSEIKEGARIDR